MSPYDPRYDLASVAAMADDLEAYLLSKELYWPLTGSAPIASRALPRLTMGGLLLALARLRAVETSLNSAERAALAQAETMLETTRSKWTSAMERKMAQELKSRLDLWRAFLQECRENRSACAEHYPPQAEIRAMIQLLVNELGPRIDSEAAHRLESHDTALRGMLQSGGFVWAEALRDGFPQDQFWFLYGKPRT